jgi:hypothetical protein
MDYNSRPSRANSTLAGDRKLTLDSAGIGNTNHLKVLRSSLLHGEKIEVGHPSRMRGFS